MNDIDKRSLDVTLIGGDLVMGTDFDTIDVTYPTSTTELYTYKLAAATVRTVTVTYTTSAKEILLQVTTL